MNSDRRVRCDIEADTTTRVVVLTRPGDRAFSTGQDL
jgi:enoyl-CoA hydratase/carnithine racemase